MQGASPWLVNLDINYSSAGGTPLSVSAVYNLQGARISSVGINGVSNVMEEAVHSLDCIASYSFGRRMTLKLQGKNLLDAERRFTQKITKTGKTVTVAHFRKGVYAGIGFSVDF